uniref:translation initiation factor IF-2 N-terminal domain-containing protein n=1 Tax=Anaerosporobacter sp. TaxID=1872529 RepID=UPI00286F5A3B
MSKIKIYELAKELDKSNKDIISFLQEKGIEVKSHMNSIEGDAVRMVREKYTTSAPAKESEPAKKVETTTASPSQEKRMNNNGQNNQNNNGQNNRNNNSNNNQNNNI